MLLRHELADGTGHFDLMFQRPPGRPEGLVTFRVQVRVDDPSGFEFGAERLGDHRPDYLTFQGPVSGGRGTVRRVAAGACRVLDEEADVFRVVVDFGSGRRTMLGTLGAGGAWSFCVTPI